MAAPLYRLRGAEAGGGAQYRRLRPDGTSETLDERGVQEALARGELAPGDLPKPDPDASTLPLRESLRPSSGPAPLKLDDGPSSEDMAGASLVSDREMNPGEAAVSDATGLLPPQRAVTPMLPEVRPPIERLGVNAKGEPQFRRRGFEGLPSNEIMGAETLQAKLARGEVEPGELPPPDPSLRRQQPAEPPTPEAAEGSTKGEPRVSVGYGAPGGQPQPFESLQSLSPEALALSGGGDSGGAAGALLRSAMGDAGLHPDVQRHLQDGASGRQQPDDSAYLRELLGAAKGMSQADIKKAQDDAEMKQAQYLSALVGAANLASKGGSGAREMVGLHPEPTPQADAEAPIRNLLQRRQQVEAARQADLAAAEAKRKADLSDPNSLASRNVQAIVSAMPGFSGLSHDAMSRMTASDFPQIAKLVEAEENVQQRRDAAAQHSDDLRFHAREGAMNRAAMRDERRQLHDETAVEKAVQNLKNDIDPYRARAGLLAANQNRVDAADRLRQLMLDSRGNVKNLDSRQMEELAIGLSSLLSGGGGAGAQARVEGLVPHTAIGNAAKLAEWLTDSPTGTNQTEFVKRMAETVDRERNLAMQKVADAQRSKLGAHGWLRQTAPERYSETLHGFGLSPEGKALDVTAPETGPKDGPPSADMVEVYDASGRHGWIPRQNLQRALTEKGFRLAR